MVKKKILSPAGWLSPVLLVVLLALAACGAAPSSSVDPTGTKEAPSAESPPASPTLVAVASPMVEGSTATLTVDVQTAVPATDTPTAPPAPEPTTPPPTPTSALSAVEVGAALFAANGCVACHGDSGQGVEGLGPALAGHSREAVLHQVREPRQVPEGSVQMPTYGPEQITDEELEQIVAFIQSLGPPMGAGPFAGSMAEAAHLRLALISLQTEDVDGARAHLEDLVTAASGETEEQASELLRLLEEGDLHEAEHELEMMLAEAQGSELTAVQLYIMLALDALQAHEDTDAIRHLESAINVATGEKTRLEELLSELREGHAHDVGHELEEMLGMESHGS